MNQQNPLLNSSGVPATNVNASINNTDNNTMHEPITWLDKQDVLQLLHISARTLQNWRTNGVLPYYKVEGKIWYKKADIEQMLTERKAKGIVSKL